MKLTIGIATCGRPNILRRCLRSIRAHTHIDYEIIVLDNAKAFTDDPDAVPNISSKYKYIEVADNKVGCCESNNILQDNCTTEYFMHLDDDVYINTDGFIDELFDTYLKLEGKYDNLGVVGASWYDTFYEDYRQASMKYVFGYNNSGKKIIKKIPINYKFVKGFGFKLVRTDECLHTMIINLEKFKKLNIRWDNKFKWKGDRLDYFMQIQKKNLVNYQLLDPVAIHDPKPFKYGSLSYEDFGGKEAKEYFYRKWGYYPLTGWDRYQVKPR